MLKCCFWSIGGYVSAVLQRYLAWFNPALTIPFATIYSNDSVADLEAMLRMIPHSLTHIFCKSIKRTLICLNRSSKPCLKQWFEVLDLWLKFGLFAIRQRRSLYAFGNTDLRFNIDPQMLLIYTDILDVDLCSAQYTINI